MWFFYPCPNCKKLVEGDVARAGALVVCPQCGAAFTLPETGVTAEPPLPAQEGIQTQPPETSALPPVPEPDLNIALVGPVDTTGWRLVRAGLTLIHISLCSLLFFGGILFLLFVLWSSRNIAFLGGP